MGTRILVLNVASLLILTFVGLSTGLSCHSCYREGSHTSCNVGVVQCDADQGEDSCYTQSERYDHFGKRYTKGCKNFVECETIASLNYDCLRAPASCLYCCQGDLCNEFSASPDVLQGIVGLVLPLAIVAIFTIS